MIKEAMAKVAAHQSMTTEETREVMNEMVSGGATPSQLGAFLTALRMKGETVEEMVGLALVMREHAVRVAVDRLLVDTCGTGNDQLSTFNVSTAAAIVVAAAGQPVAKHGNRAVTSHFGSADVLEALGIAIDLAPEGVARSIEAANFGFMLATAYHPAMKAIGQVRRELGIGTIFNVMGPLSNPAGAEAQVLGVADGRLTLRMADALRRLGCRHAYVVHGLDGMDELSISAPTEVHEVRDGWIRNYQVTPEDAGLRTHPPDSIRASSREESVATIRQVFAGSQGAPRDVVLLNAGAALAAAGKAEDLREGAALAARALDSGRAQETLEALAAFRMENVPTA
ncbi:MAG TPA: anthranilate phosphoribosyltransferase [Chloroflexota bacterium]|nr:anthranilate phosphoribosyltransferase [Chloroflexota bacterium]